ncbi:quinoprotein dehydrogenase-associated putative ABC transporter substrate-binding protein [uncultured Thiothrix sp.]|uniref:quinoprotein dehydrogenase-associated putative ABC transporter substrate-binding protein n=1 Tax=uncultured Thiothrix sp. TaxID=223185 RepID=UPI00262E545B|nr:quinoprotein dehydrogenase-associated putative ABC transporter substrate-binding protein [uncultured Thiothrix sp.]
MIVFKPATLSYLALSLCLIFTSTLQAEDASPARTALKVCADPQYMPFSNQEGKGYENRLAQLVAAELKLPLEYTWFPQRLGFIRNTLKKEQPDGEGFLCDLVMGLPTGYELTATTDPYMQSTYALVVRSDGKLASLKQATELLTSPPANPDEIKIGITESGPGAEWLAKYQLHQYMAPYPAQSGDPADFPGKHLLTDLLAGHLDAAIVWGPTAAYFTSYHQDGRNLSLLPLKSEPGVRFNFPISAGVRLGEKAWKEQVNTILKSKKAEIQQILQTEYHIPLVDDTGELLAAVSK